MYDIRADSVEIRGCAGQDKYYLQEDINKIKEQIEDTYADQLRGLDNYLIEAWPGIPHTEILKLARKEDVDLIVMVGPHTREENRANKKIVSIKPDPASRPTFNKEIKHEFIRRNCRKASTNP